MAGNGNSGRKPKRQPRSKIPALVELPDAPDDLGEHGLRHWNRLGPLLVHARVLTLVNLPSLELLCAVYERWRVNRETVKEEGSAPAGKKHPLLGVIQRDEMEMMRLNAEFGMSPATASSRVTAPGVGRDDAGDTDDDEDDSPEDDRELYGNLRLVGD